MSGSNPFRHKKTASTVGAVVAAGHSPSPTLEPGSRRHRQEPQAWDGENRRPGTAEEWLAGIDTATVKQKEDQEEDEARALFERAMVVEEYSSRPAVNSKTVRIASPPAKQIPSPNENNDDGVEILEYTVPEYTTTNSTTGHTSRCHVSTPGLDVVEDPFNAASGSSGTSDEDDDDDSGMRDVDDGGNTSMWTQEGLGLGTGVDMPTLRRVSYQEDLRRSRDHDQIEAAKGKKATMDVDAFKRLLLTGDTGAENTKTSRDSDMLSPSKQHQHPYNLGTSVAAQENHGDQTQSAASSISSQQKPDKRPPKLPPPPPKTRRGKVIARNSEPTPTDVPIRSSEAPVSPQTSTHTTGYTKSPASSIHGAPPPSPLSRRIAAQSEPSPSSNTQHKRPPTPPLTRRHSQMKRSNASISRTDPMRLSLPPNAVKPLNRSASLNSASNPKTPPPPPSRRTGISTGGDHASTTSSTPDTSSLDTPILSIQHHRQIEVENPSPHQSHVHSHSHSNNHTPASASSRPLPPPPRRTTGSNMAHSTDTTPTRRPPSISTEADNHPLPPPLPPLRKSSRSSNIAETGTTTPSNANDILADLSRLQQELDEFRGQHNEAASNRGI
ncbi:hypothetical protein FQN49_007336 [Arthroderma sp. PD_2]|nr:hypothetical protein FQN49_007336 [Arthroderma sp. PD_2]